MTDGATYSIPEACQRTGFSRAYLYKEIDAGRLSAMKIGRNRRVRSEDLERWLKIHRPGWMKARKARAQAERERIVKARQASAVFDNTTPHGQARVTGRRNLARYNFL